MKKISSSTGRLLLSFLGIGYVPVAPGTMGSLASIPLFLISYQGLKYFQLQTKIIFYWAIIGILTWAAVKCIKVILKGDYDQQWIVLDEVLGMMITYSPLLWAGIQWKWIVVGLVLFRFFDVKKPLFIGTIDRMGTPASVMLDDTAAGICALMVLTLGLWLWR